MNLSKCLELTKSCNSDLMRYCVPHCTATSLSRCPAWPLFVRMERRIGSWTRIRSAWTSRTGMCHLPKMYDHSDSPTIVFSAYWLTVTNQRWLGIRLDFMGILLTFVVAILTVGTRFSISPAQTGLVLSYIISVQQAFGWMVRQIAEVENDFNSVERIVHYSKELEQEAPHEIPDKKPAASWPAAGSIELKNVVLKYRPELPAVLNDLTMKVRPGEKIGIVGRSASFLRWVMRVGLAYSAAFILRTGAGKSSIMTALFRLVELTSGSIVIDGVDISQVGLDDLRNGLAIIPQDPLLCTQSYSCFVCSPVADMVLVSGTLRSNLDPFGAHDDARLWDALRRAYLVEDRKHESMDRQTDEEVKEGARTPVNRFSLDSPIEDEGSNLSIGQVCKPQILWCFDCG